VPLCFHALEVWKGGADFNPGTRQTGSRKRSKAWTRICGMCSPTRASWREGWRSWFGRRVVPDRGDRSEG